MSENKDKDLYLNFDEYIRQGEPAQKEKAGYWQAAIGLQAVDGLKTSEYLQQTARRNIKGEITIDEARELVNQYYITKTVTILLSIWSVSSATSFWMSSGICAIATCISILQRNGACNRI